MWTHRCGLSAKTVIYMEIRYSEKTEYAFNTCHQKPLSSTTIHHKHIVVRMLIKISFLLIHISNVDSASCEKWIYMNGVPIKTCKYFDITVFVLRFVLPCQLWKQNRETNYYFCSVIHLRERYEKSNESTWTYHINIIKKPTSLKFALMWLPGRMS